MNVSNFIHSELCIKVQPYEVFQLVILRALCTFCSTTVNVVYGVDLLN